jgi:hypothetical protein
MYQGVRFCANLLWSDLEEARAAATEMLRLNPTFTLAGFERFWPMKDPAIMERTLAALRKAGLK